jgi:hypothetical protein
MKVSTILDHIDNGHMALPEFQRGYVWNRDQVRGLFDSLYKRHPIGGLLVWATESNTAAHRGEGQLSTGIVKLLLDGQQRMTSLYGVVRGKPPKFFDGNERAFTDLRFNLETETFEFYQPVKMRGDTLWVDVSNLMKTGTAGMGSFIAELSQNAELAPNVGIYASRLSHLLAITETDLHIDEVTGKDKSLEVVVDIFNRVNSGGTKLSKGDLALAKICADWPDARESMKKQLKKWKTAGYDFNLDWLLRSVNTVLTGEAKFQFLHDKEAHEIQSALKQATTLIDKCLNLIGGRLGLDHGRVLFSRFAIPVMVRYLFEHNGALNEKERDKLLFWFVQTGMWGRFSGSVETYINQDLAAIAEGNGGIDPLLEQLRLWHGGLRVESGHFTGWGRGARFYPILYLLTRMGEARDWGNGLPLKANLLGKMNQLERHHIFPKARLYKAGFKKPQVNALPNFCFQTKETNLVISDRLPEEYFPEIEAKHPGALSSQWIPKDPSLWKLENYLAFIEERKKLLAAESNHRLEELLHGDTRWLEITSPVDVESDIIPGGISSDDEEAELEELNSWAISSGFSEGEMEFDYADPESGKQHAVFDLVWPSGLQEGLTEPIAVLLNEEAETIAIANDAGFRCFTSVESFKAYVTTELLVEVEQ